MYDLKAMTIVTNLMPLLALMSIISGLASLELALTIQFFNTSSKLIKNSQRRRYFTVLLGVLFSGLPGYYVWVHYGWHQFQLGLSDWWYVYPLFGVVAAFGMYYSILCPLVGLLAALYIYFHPAFLAKRVHGGWLKTEEVRAGVRPLPIYPDEVDDGDVKYHRTMLERVSSK